MTLELIPEPKKLTLQTNSLVLPDAASIGICRQTLYPAAKVAGTLFKRSSVNVPVKGVPDTIVLSLDGKLRAGGYRLTIGTRGITIRGHSADAVACGVQTLRQVVEQADNRTLPCLKINDWPDFQNRGVYYDVCRGRVPKLERLLELADILAQYKVNQLQLYIEHTFAFRGHPAIGAGASPLTADDILEIDEFCAARGIELLPSLSTFGHMSNVLKHPQYRHLAEDLGAGEYVGNEKGFAAAHPPKGWTLSPAVPEIYDFLDSMFAEFLPLFRSKRFNICCDETWDLGCGQSYEMCKKKGKGVVYLDHVKKVRKLCRKYGKKALFWGDIIRHYPELIDNIPSDVTVLDWGYSHNHPFGRISDFRKAGLPFYACPGTSSWSSLFPRLPEATANIHGFAAAALKNGAQGLLNTDWGDGGHYNFMEYSWHGYLFGAEQSWNVKADMKSFTTRFVKLFLNSNDRELTNAIATLGDITHLSSPCYQSVWQGVLFAMPQDSILNHDGPIKMSTARKGTITIRKQRLDASCGATHLKRLVKVRKVFVTRAKKKGVDPLGVLPYWIFAVDTIACAARKLTVLGHGGKDTPAARRALKKEMQSLMKRFEKLWMARNRRSEIRITLNRYRKAIRSL